MWFWSLSLLLKSDPHWSQRNLTPMWAFQCLKNPLRYLNTEPHLRQTYSPATFKLHIFSGSSASLSLIILSSSRIIGLLLLAVSKQLVFCISELSSVPLSSSL